MGGDDDYEGWVSNDGTRYDWKKKKPSITGMYENEVVPWKGYHDYESIVAAEDYYGVPMGEYHTFGRTGRSTPSPASCPASIPLDISTPEW